MKSRTQRKRQQRKHKRRTTRKQYGGAPGPCPAECEYPNKNGTKTHSWGSRIHSGPFKLDDGTWYKKVTEFCSKCNCSTTRGYPVEPAGSNSKGQPYFVSD